VTLCARLPLWRKVFKHLDDDVVKVELNQPMSSIGAPLCPTSAPSADRIEVEAFPALVVVDDKGNDFFNDPAGTGDATPVAITPRP
jgi:hypothetical protein